MKIEKIAVLDILGPAYHYDAQGWRDGAIEGLIERLKKHDYKWQTAEEEARDEEDLILSGKETPLFMPGFAETILRLLRHRVHPVIVSAGTPRVLEYAMEAVARDYQERTGTSWKDIYSYDVSLVSTIPIGSKKDPETWRKAIEPIKEWMGDVPTISVHEDTFGNLTAGMQGLQAVYGYHVTSTKNGLATLCSNDRVLRGHMTEALEHLEKILESDSRYAHFSRMREREMVGYQTEVQK